MPLRAQQGRNGGRIHTARHGYGDGWLRVHSFVIPPGGALFVFNILDDVLFVKY
jgi:hypothetical protein